MPPANQTQIMTKSPGQRKACTQQGLRPRCPVQQSCCWRTFSPWRQPSHLHLPCQPPSPSQGGRAIGDLERLTHRDREEG